MNQALVQTLLFLAISVQLIWISYSDIKSRLIPDTAIVLVCALGLASLYFKGSNLGLSIGFALLIYALLWGFGEVYFRIKGLEGLGIGDAKLIAAGSLLVQPAYFPYLLLLSSILSIIYILIRRLIWNTDLNKQIPFGPFLCLGLVVFMIL